MRLEKANISDIATRLYKPSKIQEVLDQFMESDDLAVRCIIAPGEYKNLKSAWTTYHTAINRLRYPIVVRTIKGTMYLIKTVAQNNSDSKEGMTMRLWHEALIPLLPRQQLLGQHRECCALRGRGWGKKHATVDYVFNHSPMWLAAYHRKVLDEMSHRGYTYDSKWEDVSYRGAYCEPYTPSLKLAGEFNEAYAQRGLVYPEEHNLKYLKECLENLERKGIHIEI